MVLLRRMQQNFHIFSMFYGQHYVDLFRRACFRSLNWPKNQLVLTGRTWNVITTTDHFDEVKKIFEGSPFKLQLFGIGEFQGVAGCVNVKTSQCDGGVLMLNGLRDQIVFCLQNNSKLLLAPPDTIFGDGTVDNLLTLGSEPETCVAVAHPRVLPSILEPIEYDGSTDGAISNQKLVSLSMKHAHDSWKFAEIGHKHNNSYMGGIAWKRLSESLISVTHRLPTPYFMGFNRSDWDYWCGTVSFGALDHSWPGDRLIRQERLRVVGSSDACFIAEVTDHDKNVPPVLTDETRERLPLNDDYWGDRLHHSVNRLFNVIWKA